MREVTVKRTFGPDDARRLVFIRDAGFVGKGRLGFYTVAEIDDELRETRSVWVFDRDGSSRRRVGECLGDVASASPSPDGATVAVLADVNGGRQICLVPLDGGEVRVLTGLPQGVTGSPVWSPDGCWIAFTTGPSDQRDPSLPYRVDRATYRLERAGYLDDVVQDIYLVAVGTGVVRRLTRDRCMNSEPRWSPDGRSICYLVSCHPDRIWNQLPELHVLTVATGESRVLLGEWGGVFRAEWCPDGERIAFIGLSADRGYLLPEKWDLWTVSAAGGEPECRTGNLLPGVRVGIQADSISFDFAGTRICPHDDAAYVNGQVGGDVVIYRVGLSGAESVERVVVGDESAYLLDVDQAGSVLYAATSFVRPPDLMLDAERITALNDDLLSGVVRADVQAFEVVADDGLRTEAWALTPPGENGPWPTVLYIHGGPYAAFGSTYMIDFQLLVGAGFAVVFHNFRGSHGYGSAFSQQMVGVWGPAGAQDHHATLDEAIRRGIADPDHLGVCGYSHGGFATCWLVGTSSRFRAAVAENPVTSWASAFSTTDLESWIELDIGGTPHDIPDAYHELSPLTYAQNCETPLLFVVGEADLRCPPAESEQYYRVLKRNGIPAEMLRLPGSDHLGTWHGPVSARIAQNEALVEWFTRFLL